MLRCKNKTFNKFLFFSSVFFVISFLINTVVVYAVNEEQTQVEQVQPTQRTVSAVSVLLSAVELAQSRGAFKVNEMQLISQAHSLVSQQEAKNQ